MNILLWIAAFVTGVLASLGVGGGMVLIIFLTVFMDYDQIGAQGINLLYFIPIAALSIIIHTKNSLIEWKKILPTICSGAVGALIGAFLADAIGSPVLKKIFAVFIIAIGIKELLFTRKSERNK